ncbi:uncharacterized protein LOC100368652, partial [Saccoglossus kowalevskii]|uniref:Uncharacterized protein LOC100368652 n=1 Tax=Saccoglossus kowalevskii TaxID=10224 RepID=A0ABM0GY84_SACKO
MHYSSEREGERERQLGQQMLQMMMQNVGQNQNTSDSQVKQMMQTLQQEFAFQIDKQEKHHQSDSYPHSDSAIPSLLPERRPSSQTYPSASSYPSDYAREEAVYQEQSYQGSKYPNPELQQPQRQSRLVDLPSKYPSYESQQPQTLSSLSDRSSSIPPLMSNPQQSDQSGVHRLLNSLEDKLRFGNLDANQAIQVRLLHGKISQIASTPQQDHNVGGRSAGIPSLLDGSSRMMDRQNGSQSGYNQYALMGDSRDSLQSGYNLEASRFAEPMPSSLGRMDSFHDYGYSMNREPTRAVDHSWYSSNSSRTSQQAYKPEQRNRRYSDVVDGHTIRRLDGNRWRCLVCQTSFSVWNDVVSHADGALHAANKHHAQKRSLERRSSGGRGLDSYSDRKRSGSPQYGGAKRAKLTYCSICKVDCNTEKSYQEHLKGKKHALSIETIMETSKKSAPSKSNKFNKKSQSSSEKKAKTYCDTCDVECHQEKSLAIHLKTSNHQRKVKEIKNDKMSAANKAHVASMFEMSIACGFGRSDKITTVEELMAYKKRITVADKLAKTFKSTDTPDADLCLICARKITKKEQDAHCKLDHHMNNIESFEKLTKWLNLFTLMVDPNKCTEAFKEIDSLEKSLKSVGKPPCPFCTLKNKNVK